MKKILFLFLSMTLLVACSNDDDNGPQEEDPIVGSWVLVDASEPLDALLCLDEESTMTFNSNNTGEATFYLVAAECAATPSSGNWTKGTDNTYTISTPVGNLQGTANFTNNNNRFTYTTMGGVLTFERQ